MNLDVQHDYQCVKTGSRKRRDEEMEIIFLPILVILWLIPILHIGLSNRTSGAEKLAWLLAVVFISWFAWVFFMLLAPLKEKA